MKPSIEDLLLASLIQGAIEWLPISSSGQVSLLLTSIIGIDPGQAVRYALMLHTGTALSALIYYIKFLLDDRYRQAIYKFIIVSYVTSLMIAVPIYLFILPNITIYLDSLNITIGLALIASGLILIYSRKNIHNISNHDHIDLKSSILYGIGQGIAILPGLSRSGLTLFILIYLGYQPRTAVKYVFIGGIPATLTAGIISLYQTTAIQETVIDPITATISIIASFIAGLLSIKIISTLAENLKIYIFNIVFGAFIVAIHIPTILYILSHILGITNNYN